MRCHLTPRRMATLKQNKTENNCRQGCEKNCNPCALLVENGTAAVENNIAVPQKIKNTTTKWSSNSTSGYISKRTESRSLRNICTSMFISLFITVKTWKQPKCPWTEEWMSKCGIDIQWDIIKLWKGNSEMCYNMDEPWGHYAKGNNLVTERQLLYDSTYMSYLELSKS